MLKFGLYTPCFLCGATATTKVGYSSLHCVFIVQAESAPCSLLTVKILRMKNLRKADLREYPKYS